MCCAGACSDPPCARCLRAPAAPLALLAAPGVRGCAPLPPDPYPRQAELAGICALRARAALRAGVFLCWRMQRPACVRAGGALPPRLFASLSAPEGRGYAPLPPDPYPRQAELAGICALRARAALRAGVFLCWRMQRPTRVRAVVARSRRAARSARGPRGRGATRPYPRTPYPRQAELAGFCALPRACCASRRCFCARARSNPHVCAGACSDPPACTKCACYAALFMK